jgi:hypothetical protein
MAAGVRESAAEPQRLDVSDRSHGGLAGDVPAAGLLARRDATAVLALQRAAGNRATIAALRRDPRRKVTGARTLVPAVAAALAEARSTSSAVA